jgi:ribosomal protein S18 acetylase RimI-like enzyme
MTIVLRDSTPEDEPFLREVYASTREQELAMTQWTDEQRATFLRFQFDAQQAHYRQQYPDASYHVILNDADLVGRLYVARLPGEIKVLDLTVLPPHRNHGIGSELMNEILAEANNDGKAVLIWVEQTSPAQELFKRLGFSKKEDDGYQDLLEWRPASVAPERR